MKITKLLLIICLLIPVMYSCDKEEEEEKIEQEEKDYSSMNINVQNENDESIAFTVFFKVYLDDTEEWEDYASQYGKGGGDINWRSSKGIRLFYIGANGYEGWSGDMLCDDNSGVLIKLDRL